MNVLDSPVEALAFNYVSFGIFAFVNSLWPLVAFLTAAVSFWKIKAAAGIITPVKKLVDEAPISAPPPQIFTTRPAVDEEPSPNFSPPSPAPAPAECCDGVTKGGKFVLYYEDDGIEMIAAEAAAAEEAEEEWSEGCGGGSEEEWWGRWERVLRTRKGEMGLYRYQDLTVINGNVVRLWEECGGGGGKCSSAHAVLCGGW